MIDKPDSGSISINGENSFSKKDIQNLRRYVFGYIFQNYALIENDTVKENLLLSKSIERILKKRVRRIFRESWDIQRISGT